MQEIKVPRSGLKIVEQFALILHRAYGIDETQLESVRLHQYY